MTEENHMTPTEIANEMNFERHSVYDVLKKEESTGSVDDKPGRGRKRKLTELDGKKIQKEAKKRKCAPEIARTFKKKSLRPHCSTCP